MNSSRLRSTTSSVKPTSSSASSSATSAGAVAMSSSPVTATRTRSRSVTIATVNWGGRIGGDASPGADASQAPVQRSDRSVGSAFLGRHVGARGSAVGAVGAVVVLAQTVLHEDDRAAHLAAVLARRHERQHAGDADDRAPAPVDGFEVEPLALPRAAEHGAERRREALGGQTHVERQEVLLGGLVRAHAPEILGAPVPDLHALCLVD